MRKYLLYILILVALVGLFAPMAQVTAAQPDTTSYQLLQPLPNPLNGGQINTNPIDVSGTNAFTDYLNQMIALFIGICAVLAVVMIVIGGIEYMTSELISNKESGKEKIKGALLGLLIALGAYALLNTINPNLLNSKLDLPDVTVTVGVDTPQQPVNNTYTHNGITYTAGAFWTGVYATLPSSPRVTIANSQCTTVGQQNCTSTIGLDPSTVNTIYNKCSACVITITGGTEFWLHIPDTSHGPNSPTVDLRVETNLTNYIESGTPTSPNKWTKDGISYLYEANPPHWHAGR